MIKIENNSDYQKVYDAYAKTGETINEFGGVTRNGDAGGFEKGDVISFPDVIRPIRVPVGNSGRFAEMVIVEVTSESGNKRYVPFYPTQFSKRIFPILLDKDGKFVKNLDPVKPLGTASEFYQSRANQSVDSVMKELANQGDVVISNVDVKDVFAFGSKNVTTARQYTFDFKK